MALLSTERVWQSMASREDTPSICTHSVLGIEGTLLSCLVTLESQSSPGRSTKHQMDYCRQSAMIFIWRSHLLALSPRNTAFPPTTYRIHQYESQFNRVAVTGSMSFWQISSIWLPTTRIYYLSTICYSALRSRSPTIPMRRTADYQSTVLANPQRLAILNAYQPSTFVIRMCTHACPHMCMCTLICMHARTHPCEDAHTQLHRDKHARKPIWVRPHTKICNYTLVYTTPSYLPLRHPDRFPVPHAIGRFPVHHVVFSN